MTETYTIFNKVHGKQGIVTKVLKFLVINNIQQCNISKINSICKLGNCNKKKVFLGTCVSPVSASYLINSSPHSKSTVKFELQLPLIHTAAADLPTTYPLVSGEWRLFP